MGNVRRRLALGLAVWVSLWSMPLQAMAVELEILGDMTSPHGGFGSYQNLVKFSEKLDDPTWTAANTVTRTADDATLAPDGSQTADKLNFGGAATVDSLQQDSGVVSTTAAYTFSIWLRSVSGGTTIVLKIEDANESNTTVVTGLSATRWERYSVTQTFATAGGNIKVTLMENAAADAPVILAWGAQLEKSSKPNVYARTIDDQIATSAPAIGLAIGKDTHITGNLEVHGSIITHGTGGGADQTIAGNLAVNGNTTLGDAATDTVTVNAGKVSLVNSTSAANALEFGSGANLANLYRSANDTLKTDDALLVASTLGVTGATTLSSTLGVTGDVAVNTNKFNVTAASGNTTVGGTLGVTGATTLSSTLGVTGNTTMNGDVTLGDAALDTVTVNAGPVNFPNATAAGDALVLGGDANLYRSAADTLKTDDALLVAGTLGVTGATTLSSTLGVTGASTLTGLLTANGGVTADGGVFTVADTTGAVHTAGDFDVATNKFTVASASGNTSVAGTLGVTGATTLSNTLAVTGNVTVNTDKFTVTAASGNTVVGGTLTAGATSVAGDLSVRSNDKVVMDSTDAGGTASDTYMVHDNANDRIRLYVDGVEVARFKK